MTNLPTAMRMAALTAALFCLAGCGSMPSAPMLDSARVDRTGAAPQAVMPVDAPADPGAQGGGGTVYDPLVPAFGGAALVEQTSDLSSDNGGAVVNGRWQVVVPAGAFEGSARISVATPAAKSWAVGLGITPVEKNHFDRPVLLVVDCHGVAPKRLSTWFISWWNPDTKTWVPVAGSVVDMKKKTVSAPLSHFSVYAVGPTAGKSGW
jgi:hypothetical protein